MQTYLFYDIESTGLSKPFDQILQFAAIRTDKQLNELERHEINIKLNPDVIPSPQACITHHIGVKDTKNSLNELEALEKIHALFNAPGTISLGYNTLNFDDEFLRFSFYRNLLPPYTHQYANRCSRMDIYPMTVMYFLFKPNVINWPIKNDKPSLKLEHINEENAFAKGKSHDAMVDVEVTLELARRLIKEKDMWDYLESFFSKMGFQEHIAKLPFQFHSENNHYREGLLVEGKLGKKNFFHAPVLHLGNHKLYRNQTLWLRLDTEYLSRSTLENPAEYSWVINKKLGEPGFILPTLERFTRYLDPERQTQAEKNKQWLAKNADIFDAIVKHYQHYEYPKIPETDIDAALYLNDFWSDTDVLFCQQFHNAAPSEKSHLIEKARNDNLKELAIRILGRHYPDALNATQRDIFDEYLNAVKAPEAQALVDFQGNKRCTADVALKNIEELQVDKTLDSDAKKILSELKVHIEKFIQN